MARIGAEVTAVVSVERLGAHVSLESFPTRRSSDLVLLGSGLLMRTTIWTEPEAPAARLPGDQVTTPLAREPPAVADTQVVLAGTVSVRTTPVALALPVLE